WKDLEIVSAVFVGGTVHVATVVENQHEMFTRSNILGAFEHHVFKEMRKTSATLAFVARTDVVRDGNCDYGCGMIFNGDHAQSVLQSGLFEIDSHVASALCLDGKNCERADKEWGQKLRDASH